MHTGGQVCLMKWKGVCYDKDGTIKKCRFCTILEENKDEIIYEDSLVAVVLPLSKSAAEHYLIIPKIHLPNILCLDKSHIKLLKRMIHVARMLLDSENISNEELNDARLLFHVPPFNSVDHLHLHVLAGKYSGWKERLKFSAQGLWCASFDSIITRIEAKVSSV